MASLDKWALIATVCAKLHNICMDKSIPSAPRFHKDWLDGDSHDVYTNIIHPEDENVPTQANGQTTGLRRKKMTEKLELMGIRRPAHAGKNSKA